MEIIKRVEFHKGETEEFLNSISYGGDYYRLFNNGFLFRGHSLSDYKLQPSALRYHLRAETERTLHDVDRLIAGKMP